MDALIFLGLILLQVVLAVWVSRARPPAEVLSKYLTRPALLSWLPRSAGPLEMKEALGEEYGLLSRYNRRVVIHAWSIVLSVMFMCSYIYFSVGA